MNPTSFLTDPDRRLRAALTTLATHAGLLAVAEDWQKLLPDLLEDIGRGTEADRVYLFQVFGTPGRDLRQSCLADWAAPGLDPLVGDPINIDEPLETDDPTLRSWVEKRQKGETIQGLTKDLTGYLRQDFERQRILAFLSFPILVRGRWWGHLGIDDCQRERVWSDHEKTVLSATVALLAGAIARHEATANLIDERATTRAIVNNALDAIVTCDAEGRIETFNPAAETVFRRERRTVIGQPLADILIPPHHRSAHQVGFKRLTGGAPHRILGSRLETEGWRGDARAFPIELTVTEIPPNRRGRRFAAHIRDISQAKRAAAELESLAFGDAGTGLPNRAGFLRRLVSVPPTAILVIELTGLTEIKVTFGVRFMNLVLRALAGRLTATLDRQTTVGRIGDQSFAVASTGRLGEIGDPPASLRIVRDLLSKPFSVDGRLLHLAARIGWSLDPAARSAAASMASESPTEETALPPQEALLRDAELAATLARIDGPPQRYDPSMRTTRLHKLELEAALREAISDPDAFTVHYQPIVGLERRHIAGFEALVRWQHPSLGTVPPLDFIPLAEATGLIVPLGHTVLLRACQDAASWPRAEGISVAVNLSPIQLTDPDLVARVDEALARTGLPPGRLKLEITESGVMESGGAAVERLHALRARGIVLALDDFGTGYSSLAMLRDLPVSILKVDRSFVQALGRSREDAALLRHIVGLAGSLHLDTVGEGIEREGDAWALAAMGCTHGQGWFFGRPDTAEAARTRIEAAPADGPA